MRTRAERRQDASKAASNAPEEILTHVLRFLVQHHEYATPRQIALQIVDFGLVNKQWQNAAAQDSVWQLLVNRASPAPVRAAVGAPLRNPPVSSEEREDDRAFYGNPARVANSRYFAEAIVSPFRAPSVPTCPSWKDVFRHRLLAAEHARASYRETAVGERYGHVCICTSAAKPDAATPSVPLSGVSFIFEVFELDASRRERQRGLDGEFAAHESYLQECAATGKAVMEGCEEHHLDRHDYITDELRQAYAGPPHFAWREDLGRHIRSPPASRRIEPGEQRAETENLVWSATVRARDSACGVYADVPWTDGGKLLRKYSVPVDTASDCEQWLTSFRLVVTAVRDADGKACQLVDVRGFKRDWNDNTPWPPLTGFREAFDFPGIGKACFRIAEATDTEEAFDVAVLFGTNLASGPRTQGDPWPREPWDMSDDEDDDDDDIENYESPVLEGADGVAQRAFDTAVDRGGRDHVGALMGISMSHVANLSPYVDDEMLAARKAFLGQLESRLATLHWS